MSIDRMLELCFGDEKSKHEFKLAFKKATKIQIWLSILLSLILFPIMSYAFSSVIREYPEVFWLHLFPFIFSLLPALLFGSMLSHVALHYLTLHIKISLPETIAPKIELRSYSEEMRRRQSINPNDYY